MYPINFLHTKTNFLKPLFWDVDRNKLLSGKHNPFIIQRILEKGDLDSIYWLLKNFPEQEVRTTIKSNTISRKTAWFWSLILDINPSDIRCLQKFYHRQPGTF